MKLKPKVLVPALIVPLLIGGLGYKMTRPKPIVHMKVTGSVYVLPKDFLLNLNDGQYAKLTVGLVLAPGQSDGVTEATAGVTPPNGIGTLPEEAVVRDIITNIVTNESGRDLIDANGRLHTKQLILKAIKADTDVKVTEVLFPDVAVQ